MQIITDTPLPTYNLLHDITLFTLSFLDSFCTVIFWKVKKKMLNSSYDRNRSMGTWVEVYTHIQLGSLGLAVVLEPLPAF